MVIIVIVWKMESILKDKPGDGNKKSNQRPLWKYQKNVLGRGQEHKSLSSCPSSITY